MAKPPKPAQLTAQPEAQFYYDGTGDIYRPLRLLYAKYTHRAICATNMKAATFYAGAANAIELLLPKRVTALGSGVAYANGALLGKVPAVKMFVA